MVHSFKNYINPKALNMWASFFPIKLVFTMSVLENLKTVDYPLLVLTNWVLHYIFNYKLKN